MLDPSTASVLGILEASFTLDNGIPVISVVSTLEETDIPLQLVDLVKIFGFGLGVLATSGIVLGVKATTETFLGIDVTTEILLGVHATTRSVHSLIVAAVIDIDNVLEGVVATTGANEALTSSLVIVASLEEIFISIAIPIANEEREIAAGRVEIDIIVLGISVTSRIVPGVSATTGRAARIVVNRFCPLVIEIGNALEGVVATTRADTGLTLDTGVFCARRSI